jgi:hypothetical protein
MKYFIVLAIIFSIGSIFANELVYLDNSKNKTLRFIIVNSDSILYEEYFFHAKVNIFHVNIFPINKNELHFLNSSIDSLRYDNDIFCLNTNHTGDFFIIDNNFKYQDSRRKLNFCRNYFYFRKKYKEFYIKEYVNQVDFYMDHSDFIIAINRVYKK